MEDALPGHDWYAGMLAIPYLRRATDQEWSVVSIRFRCIEPQCEHHGHGKYNTVSGDRPRLYNTTALQKPNDVVGITEGELDAITATQVGIDSVGLPGVQSWLDHFTDPFLGYETVYVFADGDEPGKKFAHAIGTKLPNAVTIPMPPGEDVNSFVLSEGPEALLGRIK